METKTNRRARRARLALSAFVTFGVVLVATSPGAADAPAKTVPAPAQLERVDPPAQVAIIDNTRGRWGDALEVAVGAWDRSPRVNMWMSSGPVDGAYNVYVSAYDHKESGWCGLASYLDRDTMHILLNTSCRDHRTGIAAHELGHALGIDHPAEDAPRGIKGVIAGTPGAEPADVPTGADYAAMREAQRTATYGAFALARNQ